MAFSRAQNTISGFLGSGTSVSVAFGSNCTPGSTIIVACSAASGSTTLKVSDDQNGGYPNSVIATGPGLTACLFYFTNQQASTKATVTFTSTASVQLRFLATEWLGIDSTPPIFFPLDLANGGGGTSTSLSAGTMGTLAQAGELVVAYFGCTSAATWTAGSGFTLDPIVSGSRGNAFETQVVSGTTGPACAATISSSLAYVGVAASFRPAFTRKVISITSGSSFTAPADWPGTADRVDVIGGGAAGRSGNSATAEGLGGGGGAYTFQNNVVIANGAAVQVGAGGSSNAQNGTPTWVVNTTTVYADGGKGPLVATGGVGGSIANCVPSGNASAGGNGGAFSNSATAGATGGGGSGSYYGNGGAGGNQNATGTTGGTGGGGGGGAAGTNQTASNGNGTTGGLAGSYTGPETLTGGAGGTTPTGGGSAGTGLNTTGGGGGGGGASDGSGNGGGGGAGGGGSDWTLTNGGLVGSGGGGGGTGNQTSGAGPPFAGNGGLYGGGGGGGGNGTYTSFGSGSNGLIVITYTPANPNLSGQTVTLSQGQTGVGVGEALTNQSITSSEGTLTTNVTLSLGSQAVSINEGTILFGTLLGPQTITSTEGVITAALSNTVTLSLSALTAQFHEGRLADNISYILDQNFVIVAGQTAQFTEGVINETLSYSIGSQAISFVEGSVTESLAKSLTAITITSVEGAITAQAGSSFNANLLGQNIASGLGAIGFEVDYFPTAFTVTSSEGVITFSNTQDITLLLGSLNATFTEGNITFPQGTGPPLFIPPTLGKPVTTRTFSWLEMASRAWGSEFRAPDHRIYQFSGGNYKDSTDLGTTGIYSPNLGPQDNPPPSS